ncbi:MAG: sigma-70 family RNA polymerase sigma factor [Saprospiraceae bacterium]|nr:sigma-70 family RNA polymerase sigma factor [Saprospiraceae bacterium]
MTKLIPLTDADIISGIKKDDSNIIAWVFNHFKNPVQQVLIKYGASPEEAQDHYMDGLEALYINITRKGLVLDKASFSTYLHQVCLHHWFKTLRRKKLHSQVTNEDVGVHSDMTDLLEDINQVARIKLYREKLALLSPECQKVLHAAIIGGKLGKMGYTEGFARKKKYECKEKLFKLIKQDPIYSELI